jgi:hypothetical protein
LAAAAADLVGDACDLLPCFGGDRRDGAVGALILTGEDAIFLSLGGEPPADFFRLR